MNSKSNSELEFRKIKSLDYKYEVNENGTIFRNVKTGKESKIVLDMHHSKIGYYKTSVHLNGRTPEAKTKRVMIHSVVAECFLGEKPDGYEIDHIDRNSKNNDYRNLRYVTKSEQMKNRDHSNISIKGTKNLNAHQEELSNPIYVYDNKTNAQYDFRSFSYCAKELASLCKYELSEEQILYLLRRRYNIIASRFDIVYLNDIENQTYKFSLR
jgi:hypothetical protein